MAGVPNLAMNVPSSEKDWMRRLSRSATSTLPLGATVIPRGLLNWPSAVPCEPHFVMKAPLAENFSTRWLFVSTM